MLFNYNHHQVIEIVHLRLCAHKTTWKKLTKIFSQSLCVQERKMNEQSSRKLFNGCRGVYTVHLLEKLYMIMCVPVSFPAKRTNSLVISVNALTQYGILHFLHVEITYKWV